MSRLRRGIVLRVREESCEIVDGGQAVRTVRFAAIFPSPRTERISPGHLVATATAPDADEVVVWRWYDAVVLGDDAGAIRMWEPGHGEVLARSRRPERGLPPGTRAYLSAGLPGADWWVADAVPANADDAAVELDEVERFLTDHDLWRSLA